MLAGYIPLHSERDNRAKWKTFTCRWERARTCQWVATLQTARTLKLMKSSGIRAGIWATSLLVHTNLPQLRKICICSFKLGVHIFLGDFWHLECLHRRLVSFSDCFHSLHLFPLFNNSFVHFYRLLTPDAAFLPVSLKSALFPFSE